MVDRITKRSEQIGSFPLSGRGVPEYDIDQTREVFCGSYRLIYHIRSDRVDTLAVLHGAQKVLEDDGT